MEYPSDVAPESMHERIVEPGTRINDYQIRAVLVPLSQVDTAFLATAFHLEPDALHLTVHVGTYLLSTDAVSREPSVSYREEEDERSFSPVAGTNKISIGEHPINKIGLYLDRAKVEELLGYALDDPP